MPTHIEIITEYLRQEELRRRLKELIEALEITGECGL